MLPFHRADTSVPSHRLIAHRRRSNDVEAVVQRSQEEPNDRRPSSVEACEQEGATCGSLALDATADRGSAAETKRLQRLLAARFVVGTNVNAIRRMLLKGDEKYAFGVFVGNDYDPPTLHIHIPKGSVVLHSIAKDVSPHANWSDDTIQWLNSTFGFTLARGRATNNRSVDVAPLTEQQWLALFDNGVSDSGRRMVQLAIDGYLGCRRFINLMVTPNCLPSGVDWLETIAHKGWMETIAGKVRNTTPLDDVMAWLGTDRRYTDEVWVTALPVGKSGGMMRLGWESLARRSGEVTMEDNDQRQQWRNSLARAIYLNVVSSEIDTWTVLNGDGTIGEYLDGVDAAFGQGLSSRWVEELPTLMRDAQQLTPDQRQRLRQLVEQCIGNSSN